MKHTLKFCYRFPNLRKCWEANFNISYHLLQKRKVSINPVPVSQLFVLFIQQLHTLSWVGLIFSSKEVPSSGMAEADGSGRMGITPQRPIRRRLLSFSPQWSYSLQCPQQSQSWCCSQGSISFIDSPFLDPPKEKPISQPGFFSSVDAGGGEPHHPCPVH